MKFDEWHDARLDGDPDTCPHKEWERVAWDAALEEAAKVADEYIHGCCIAEDIRNLKTKE